MGVLVEAISVIVPVRVLEEKYPGGVQGYARNCPNGTYCSDGSLTRVGFMVPADVEAFLEHLAGFGLVSFDGARCIDMAVVDQRQGPTARCDWCEFGVHRLGFSVAWLTGTSASPMAAPPGWTVARARSIRFAPAEERAGRFLRLARKAGVEIYLDFRTGR